MNIRYVIVGVFLATALLTTGCADFKAYMKDRGNDLADCFTARVGPSYGLGVRTQVTNYLSLSAGGSFKEEKSGYFGRKHIEAEGFWVGIPAGQLLSPFTIFFALVGGFVEPWDENERLIGLFGVPVHTDFRKYKNCALPSATSFLGINVSDFLETRSLYRKKERMKPPTPFLREKFFIEVGATIGALGFDLGFNPVEFVDFLLGWFGVDMTGDDTKTGSLPESDLAEFKESDEKNKSE